MHVGLLGIGRIGDALAGSLAGSSVVTDLTLISAQDPKRAKARAEDIRQWHGKCCDPTAIVLSGGEQITSDIEFLIVTLGTPVPRGGKRSDVATNNSRMLRKSIVPMLRGYKGFVLVVTNPVDLMTRLILTEARIDATKVLGLGTYVDTSRLRSVLAELTPGLKANFVEAMALGSHDEHFVVDWRGFPPPETPIFVKAMESVRGAADRVKCDNGCTLTAVVQCAMDVFEAIASDSGFVCPVSVLDPDSGIDELCYSVPCILRRDGVLRWAESINPAVRFQLEQCKQHLRESITRIPPPGLNGSLQEAKPCELSS